MTVASMSSTHTVDSDSGPQSPGKLARSTGLVDVRGRVHRALSDDESDADNSNSHPTIDLPHRSSTQYASADTNGEGKKARRTSFAGFSFSSTGQTLQRAASAKIGQLGRTLSRNRGSSSSSSSTASTQDSERPSKPRHARSLSDARAGQNGSTRPISFAGFRARSGGGGASHSTRDRHAAPGISPISESGATSSTTTYNNSFHPSPSSSQPPPSSQTNGLPPSISTPCTLPTRDPSTPEIMADVAVPALLRAGTPMTKVSAKKQKQIILRLDPDLGRLEYNGKHHRLIPLECIREIRTGPDGRYYREQFHLSATHEDRWLSLIYILPSSSTYSSPSYSSKDAGKYKTLHLLATTRDVFRLWDDTLRRLVAVRTALLSGLADGATREAVWARQHWAAADGEGNKDALLDFSEVERLCRKMNVNAGTPELKRLFAQADEGGKGTLDFEGFQRFVKLLKQRPEVARLFKKTTALSESPNPDVDYTAFRRFVKEVQKEDWSEEEVERQFRAYAVQRVEGGISPVPSPAATPAALPDGEESFVVVSETPVEQAKLEEVQAPMSPMPGIEPPVAHAPPATGTTADDATSATGTNSAPATATEGAASMDTAAPATGTATPTTMPDVDVQAPTPIDIQAPPSILNTENDPHASPPPARHAPRTPSPAAPALNPPDSLSANEPTLPPLSSLAISYHAFSSFLLSSSCAPIAQSTSATDVMTLPLPNYYISSSHNTYLVGHQLVGDATIEGYIRALLHGCRSVELDIYDSPNDVEPCVTHGNTLTSRVPVRAVARAISRYAFVASPYPIVISAEVHCGLVGQSLIAKIFKEEFGDALVCGTLDGTDVIKSLPSPEELKGRVLLKAKNLTLSKEGGLKEKDVTVGVAGEDEGATSTDTSSSSASEGEGHHQEHQQQGAGQRQGRIKAEVKEIKQDLKSMFKRVRGKSKSPAPAPAPAAPSSTTTPSTTTAAAGQAPSASPSAAPATLAPPHDPPHADHPRRASTVPAPAPKAKTKMHDDITALLVYTVGVKCRGLNKKETYAPEHVFSLSERTAARVMKAGSGALDLVKHTRNHLVRIYPKGMRVSSSNYHPHRFWAVGAQLVALNWQTCDLGVTINHAMFERNGRVGYVLKPLALRDLDSPGAKEALLRPPTRHMLDITLLSAQQLPQGKKSLKDTLLSAGVVDPYVEISIHVPDWSAVPFRPSTPLDGGDGPVSYDTGASQAGGPAPGRVVIYKSAPVKNNGFNPVWEEKCSLPFELVGGRERGMMDLVFVRFAVRDEGDDEDDTPIAVFCASLGSLRDGYRHLPLNDAQLSQYLFSTLFVHIAIRDV